MVDALLPFGETFAAEYEGKGSAQALVAAAAAASRAAADTASLSPKLGRARPLAEKSVGHADPGAISFGLIAEAVAARLGRLGQDSAGNS